MWLSFRVQIMPDIPHLSETSSEILRYRSNVRYQLSEMLLTFFTLSSHKIMTSQQVSWFSNIIFYFLFFRTSLHKLAIKFRDKDASTFKFFHAIGISFDSSTWISHFHSLILKFRTTSNLKITSKKILRKQKK